MLIGCTTQDNTKTEGMPTKNWETYRNDIDKIQFQYPNGFNLTLEISQTSKGSRAYFTNYGRPDESGLPPLGGAHINYVSLPYKSVEFDRYIEERTVLSDYPDSKTETTMDGLPAIRLEGESPKRSNPAQIVKEITYLTHDEERMYQFFIEYFKGDPNSAKLEEDFESMMKTVKILS